MKKAFTWTLQFKNPEPPKPHKHVWPVFIPFAGCPYKCIYCSQFVQSGQANQTPEQTVLNMNKGIMARYQRTGRPVSLGFFGGTFTALEMDEMIYYLEHASFLKEKGAVDHLRCSTRPDCIGEKELIILKSFGLDMVELGIQSFDDRTLKCSGRGYSPGQAVLACSLVKKHGLELGIQLLPGLPGSGCTAFTADIEITRQIMPDIVRIYPCLVLKKTPLAKQMQKGHYRPWNLQITAFLLSRALLRLWQEKIIVIRLGLAPEPELIKNILAGPWHPALGAICRSEALRYYILLQLAKSSTRPSLLYIPEKYVSDFWGYKKMNVKSLSKKGITRDNVRIWNKKDFKIYFHDQASAVL